VDTDPNPEKQILSEVIYVESYKKYNMDQKFNDVAGFTSETKASDVIYQLEIYSMP